MIIGKERTMRTHYAGFIGTTLCIAFGLVGCQMMGGPSRAGFSYKNMPVADGSAAAGEGNKVLFRGNPSALVGNGVKVGDQLRDVKVAQNDLSLVIFAQT